MNDRYATATARRSHPDLRYRRFAIIALLACVIGSTVGKSSLAQDSETSPGVSIHKIPDRSDVVTSWAVDRESGRLFGSLTNKMRVVEFDVQSGQEIRRLVMPGEVESMSVKGDRLVIHVPEKQLLLLLDLETNRPTETIEMEERAEHIAASDGTDPYVYALAPVDEGVEVTQYDVSTATTVNSRISQDFPRGGQIETRPTPGGGPIFLTAFSVGNHGRSIFQLDEKTLVLEQVPDSQLSFRHSREHFQVVPSGHWWTFGGKLFAAPSRNDVEFAGMALEPIRTFEGESHTFHHQHDLVVCLALNRQPPEILLQRFSDASTIKRLSMPTEFFRYDGQIRITTIQFSTLWLEARKPIITSPRGFAVVDLAQLGVALQDILLIEPPSVAEGPMEQELSLQLTAFSPGKSDDLKFSLVNGPNGLTVSESGEVAWTPERDDVGRHTVAVRAASGNAFDEIKFEMRITRPKVTLDGPISILAVDREGHRALAGCEDSPSSAERDYGYQRRVRPVTKLILIDLLKMEVLAERTLNEPAVALCLTSDAAFVGHSEGGKIYRLKLDDLSEQEKVFLASPPLSIWQLDDSTLHVETRDGSSGFSTADLAQVSLPGFNPAPNDGYDAYGRRFVASCVSLSESTSLRGVVLDSAGNVQMISGLQFRSEIPSVTAAGESDRWSRDLISHLGGRRELQPAFTPQPWDRMVNEDGLYDVVGRRLARWSGQSKLLTKQPLAAVLKTDGVDENPQRRRENREATVGLEMRDLTEGRVVRQFHITTDSSEKVAAAIERGNSFLAETSDQFIVTLGASLFRVDVSEAQLDDVQEPLWFEKQVEPMAADVGGVVEIPLRVRGGNGQPKFRLVNALDSVSIDAQSGVVSINTQEIWEHWLNQDHILWHIDETSDDQSGFERAQTVFEMLFGRSTSDIPLCVDFDVIATDEQGQTSTFSNQLVMLGPIEELEAVVAERKEEMERERERIEEERRLAAAEKAAAASKIADNELDRSSIDELKSLGERLNRIQASFATIKDQQNRLQESISAEVQSRSEVLDKQLADLTESLRSIEGDNSRASETWLIMIAAVFAFAVVALIGVGTLFRMRK